MTNTLTYKSFPKTFPSKCRGTPKKLFQILFILFVCLFFEVHVALAETIKLYNPCICPLFNKLLSP